jgi:cell pole-organizing protein PopZ
VLGGTVVLCILLGWLLWVQDVKNRVIPRNFAVVEAPAGGVGGLFRSGRLSESTSEETLRANHIGVVVSLLADEDHPETAGPFAEAVKKLGIERHIYPMNGDGLSTPEQYANAVEAAAKGRAAGKSVLVHCMTGSQRTGGVIAAYELLVNHASPEVAMRELLRRGHDPSDNPKLLPWLNQNLPVIAAELVKRGVIPAVPEPMPRL